MPRSAIRSAGARLGRRAPERRRARAKALDAGRRPVRRRGMPRGDRRAGRERRRSPRRASTSRSRRLLREKFRLGLFDEPYVDPEAAERIVGSEAFRAAGEAAQRRSIVLLKNGPATAAPLCRCNGGQSCISKTSIPEVAAEYGEVVSDARRRRHGDAAAAGAVRATRGLFAGPSTPAISTFPRQSWHASSDLMRDVPTVVDIYLDRPAVIPEIAAASAALLANFGAADTAVLDVIFGRVAPEGKLPFELPSLDGRGAAAARGRAVRLGGPAVCVRPRAFLLGQGAQRIHHKDTKDTKNLYFRSSCPLCLCGEFGTTKSVV